MFLKKKIKNSTDKVNVKLYTVMKSLVTQMYESSGPLSFTEFKKKKTTEIVPTQQEFANSVYLN